MRFEQGLGGRPGVRRVSALLFLLSMVAYSYFFNCGGWNQNARYDSIFAFVEPGTDDYHTFHIDRFVADPNKGLTNTGDWSYYKGHFYSNKAPGTTFLGIPVYMAIFHLERRLAVPWNHPYIEILNAYLINFFITVLPGALAMVCFFHLLLSHGASTRRAAVFAILFALCTPMLPYSTSLWGHVTALSFVIFAMLAVEAGGAWLFAAGAFAGIATLTDYFALIPTICLGFMILWRGGSKVWRYVLGGVPMALLMLFYNHACFDSPFVLATKYTNRLFISREGAFGIFAFPSPEIFLNLLFGLHRGMLLAVPLLLLAVPGFFFLRRKDPVYAWCLSAGVVATLLLNSAFNGWHGGNTAFARYQIVLLPFWMMLVSSIPFNRVWRSRLAIFAAVSFFNVLGMAAVCSQPVSNNVNPIYGTIYIHMFRGEFSVQKYPIRLQRFNPDWPKFAYLTSWNAGELMGLRGWSSLLPLGIAVACLIFLIFKSPGRAPPKAPDEDETVREKAGRVLAREKVAVFIVAYNAEKTVESVLRRIPGWVAAELAEIYVIDDSSTDGTAAKLRSISLSGSDVPFKVFETPYNLGYGGNQKMGYSYAAKQGFDIVVLLHGDGQYAPEFLPAILAEYDDPANAAVFGTRFATAASPLKGGMPFYKWFGNRILTKIQNILAGSNLSEMHSGYRSYRVECLKRLPFEKNSNDFHFDAEIILQHVKAGFKIREVPIPTFYGDEICYVNGLQYAWNCLKTAVKFRLMEFGVFYDPKFDIRKNGDGDLAVEKAETSLPRFVRGISIPPAARVLALGFDGGAALEAAFGKREGVVRLDGRRELLSANPAGDVAFADFDSEWLFAEGKTFDYVFALDVLEHLVLPEAAAKRLFEIMASGGVLYASTANIAYFIPRIMLALGCFNYSEKGILDMTHKRLFTIHTFRRLLENAGFKVERLVGFGPPLRDLRPDSRLFAFMDAVAAKLARWWPSMFAFNFLLICKRPDSVDDLMGKMFESGDGDEI